MRILIADDESIIRMGLKSMLVEMGHEVTTATNGREAAQMARRHIFELAILDIKMPHLNGLALYRELKKIDHDAKICFLTAGEMFYGDYSDIFNSVGAEGFMRKPIENQKLVERVRKIISS